MLSEENSSSLLLLRDCRILLQAGCSSQLSTAKPLKLSSRAKIVNTPKRTAGRVVDILFLPTYYKKAWPTLTIFSEDLGCLSACNRGRRAHL
jgi:hypothetical protein